MPYSTSSHTLRKRPALARELSALLQYSGWGPLDVLHDEQGVPSSSVSRRTCARSRMSQFASLTLFAGESLSPGGRHQGSLRNFDRDKGAAQSSRSGEGYDGPCRAPPKIREYGMVQFRRRVERSPVALVARPVAAHHPGARSPRASSLANRDSRAMLHRASGLFRNSRCFGSPGDPPLVEQGLNSIQRSRSDYPLSVAM